MVAMNSDRIRIKLKRFRYALQSVPELAPETAPPPAEESA